jgi:hypothetical protein
MNDKIEDYTPPADVLALVDQLVKLTSPARFEPETTSVRADDKEAVEAAAWVHARNSTLDWRDSSLRRDLIETIARYTELPPKDERPKVRVWR